MTAVRHRSSILAAAATAALALALTACGGEGTGTKSAGPAKSGASPVSTASVGTEQGGTQEQGDGAEAGSTGQAATGTVKTAGVTKAGAKKTTGHDTDSYAYTHPCQMGELTVRVTTRSGSPSQRVIEVRNTGVDACGLSHYPRVDLGDSHSADRSHNVKPRVPSGLGGAPAYPVRAGQTAYAVIDIDPDGATRGLVEGIDEMNVLVNGDSMPNADTRNFPLGAGAKVRAPKLGLYRASVADAAASMAQADTQL